MQDSLNVAKLIEMMSVGKGAKFASFKYRAKETGELSQIVVILGASTQTLYEKDIEKLNALIPILKKPLDLQAAYELLESREQSLEQGIGHNDLYTCADVYVVPIGLPTGIKVHKETGEVYVTGLVEHKTVLEQGVHKEVKSSAKTLAKNAIRKGLPSTRFRQYILRNIRKAKMNGEVLELEEEE